MRGTDSADIISGFDTGFNNNTNEVFKAGSGGDVANGGVGDDILYGEEISAEDIELIREGDDLIISNVKSDDKVTVSKAFYHPYGYNFIGSIEFADGTVWGTTELRNNRKMVVGTDGADTLTGFNSGYNYNTNEIFDGGAGNDIIEGGNGSDTYIFYAGSGNDTIYDYSGTNKIQFTDDIRPEDIAVSRVGANDVVLTIAGCEDSITIQDFMYGPSYSNFTLTFADGRTATFGVTDLCLVYEPAEEESVADLDTLAQENAQSLANIMSEGDVTNDTQTTTSQNDLSAIMSEDESVDVSTDTQAGLLAQELSASTTDNNVFTADNTTTVEQTQLFTEQCIVA